MIDLNWKPKPPADPVFEAGRQDALNKLQKKVEGDIKFMKSLLDNEDPNIKISRDYRMGFLEGCQNILQRIHLEKTYEHEKNIVASL